MLEAAPANAPRDRRLVSWLRTGLRLLFGYLAAVLTGAVVFMLTIATSGRTGLGPDSTDLGLTADVLLNVAFYAYIGGVFGLPYTILATIAFVRWLPRSMPLFLLLGALCPMVSVLLTMAALDVLWYLDTQFVTVLLLTLPAGLAAAYVLGALGMGWGFGRWRFA
jgi:hypothetical protein